MTMMTETVINHEVIALEQFNNDNQTIKQVASTELNGCIISTVFFNMPFMAMKYETSIVCDDEECIHIAGFSYADALDTHTICIGRVLMHGNDWDKTDMYTPQQYHYIGTIQKPLDEFEMADLFTFEMIA